MVYYKHLVNGAVVETRIPYPAVLKRTGLVDQVGLTARGYVEDLPVFVPPEKTVEQVQSEIVQATQNKLDVFAKTRNYDGILSACTYATSSISKFASEGQAAVDARDVTWSTLYTILGEVQTNTRPVPTGFADIEADLPVLGWPT